MYEGDIKLLSFDGGGVRGLSSVVTAEESMETVSNGEDPMWCSLLFPCPFFAPTPRAPQGGVTRTSIRGDIAARLADMHELIDEKKELSGTPSRLNDLFLPKIVQDQFYISTQQGVGDQTLDKVDDMAGAYPKNGLQTIIQVFEAIDHLHVAISHRWTVHEDLKPNNILCFEGEPRPQFLLTDFGIARSLDTPNASRPSEGRPFAHSDTEVESKAGYGQEVDMRYPRWIMSKSMPTKRFFTKHDARCLLERNHHLPSGGRQSLQEVGRQMAESKSSLNSGSEARLSSSKTSLRMRTKNIVRHCQKEQVLVRLRSPWFAVERSTDGGIMILPADSSTPHHLVRHRARIRAPWPLDLPAT